MFSIIFVLITWPTSDLVVWTSGDSPVTVMLSATVATFMVKSTFVELPTCTMAPLNTIVAKPESSAVTE